MNNGFRGFEWDESVTMVKKKKKKKERKKKPDKTFQSDSDDRRWEVNPGYWQWEWTNKEANKQCFITEICRSWWIVAILGGGSGNN